MDRADLAIHNFLDITLNEINKGVTAIHIDMNVCVQNDPVLLIVRRDKKLWMCNKSH